MDGIDGKFIAQAAAYIGAAIAIAIGTMGPALGQGAIGKQACESLGKYPESAGKIQRAMILALGIVEASAVYALIIAFMLVRK
ncbi:MAG TPA: ATP synthase F0 subunit C [Candidatus Babeliales bacterium]|jgi:F-type H+-transporting ATPase subunit c|nr:ATP synthase F0 subunit C [Candidatus Babeliales bacterium]